MKRRSFIGRLLQAARLSVLCIAYGLRGAKYCARKANLRQSRFWISFFKQTVRDLICIGFHEILPDSYEPEPAAAKCTVLFVPGYSMTANGASPLLSNICGAGCQVAKCEMRMWFRNVRKITRWARKQVIAARTNGLKPILLGYSMGGDIAQHMAGKMGVDAISLSTPVLSQHTFFAALDLLLRGSVSSRTRFRRGGYRNSLSETFSFHIPRPDREGHAAIKGVYSHFGVNNPDVIQAVVARIKELEAESCHAADGLARYRFALRGLPAEWAEPAEKEVV
jgi:pimeloyl-ACP methyl ester carboxylesterase